MQLAREIQKRFSRRLCPIYRVGHESARGGRREKSAAIFYDYFELPGNRLGLVIAELQTRVCRQRCL